jgi:tetrahydromethanopterin S-methyltransferase subunit H
LLRKKRAKSELELAAIVSAYDQAMADKKGEIDKLTEVMEMEKEELRELQASCGLEPPRKIL